LKKALEPHLPHDVLYRPKMGFGVPLGKWFRGPLKRRIRESLLEGNLAQSGMFRQNYLEQLVNDHQSGLREYSAPLWALMMFQASMADDDISLA
ncbi:asparagine synthase C-terminal domain-containing protein, partial [Halioglobus sp.]|nr:asparagine synthase C-terminal domain-containing protein [Halioglobus sp.]